MNRRLRVSIFATAAAVLAGVPATAMATPSAVAQGAPVVVPAAIDPTGATDVTRQLQSFFAETPDGSTVVFPAGARYRAEGTIRLVDRHGLVIEGNGAELFMTTRGDRTRSNLLLRGGGGYTIRGLVITGANPNAGVGESAFRPALEAQHGIEAEGVRGLVIEGVHIRDVYGDFINLTGFNRRVGRQWQYEWTTDVVITGSRLERNGRQGISVTAAEHVRIEDNRISDTRRATFDIEPPGRRDGARDIWIVGNEVGRGRLNFVTISGHGRNVDGIHVIDNVVHREFVLVAKSSDRSRRSNLEIRGNVSTRPFGSPRAGIELYDWDGAVIADNTLQFAPARRMVAVASWRSCGIVVEGTNTFAGAQTVSVLRPHRCP